MLIRKEGFGWFALATIVALSLALPGAAAELPGAQMRGARLEVGPTRLDWLSQADYQQWILTVAGPGDLYIRREFKGGKAPFLSLFDSKGDRLPDGSYNWELRGIPKPGALPREELLKSGHFFVREGSFAAAPVATAAHPPKAPQPNITPKNFVETGTLVVQNNACIGTHCANNDASFPTLKLKSTQPNVLFDDIDIPCEDPPCVSTAHDWALVINPSDVAQFSIRDVDGSLVPFTVAAGAPDNSLYVRSNGDVGLGTATPAEKLHLFENVDANTFLLVENPNTGLSAAGVLRAQSDSAIVNFEAHGSGRTISRFGQTLASWAEFLQVTGNGLIIGTLADKPLILGTNNSNRLHITASGNVGIGTTSPTHPLEMASGAHVTTGGVWTNASSRELKRDIHSLGTEEALSALAGLKPVRFRYKADPADECLGFIAEDVPEIVAAADRKTLSPMDLTAVLTKVVQEQQKAIVDLRAEVASLSEKLAAMEKRK